MCIAMAMSFESSARIPDGDAPSEIDFQRDIRPLLSKNCFRCHGPDAEAREARLRLDTREGAMAALRGGGVAIVPGDPSASGILHRIKADDPMDLMPPKDSGLTLGKDDIRMLEQWIGEGAEWKNHWAFIPPYASNPSDAEHDDWGRDPIDRFILDELEANGMTPADEASELILLRRLSFDLTGLPPDPDTLNMFLADDHESRYEHAIDRLMDSPSFGERMATGWLDLARYADTYGYQSDVDRVVWPYRDWVIRAFNENLPYDQFMTWQLAGDLLPDATRDQKLATAFNRLHRQTNEGGSIEEEYRTEYVADRVHTFGTAMLGMTFECARCHDHKYDPVSQHEYYQLASFFDNIDESGLYSHFTRVVPTPALPLPTPEMTSTLADRRTAVKNAEAALELVKAERLATPTKWLKSNPSIDVIPDLIGHYPLDQTTEGQSPNAHDPSNAARLVDGPMVIPGRFGNALELNGENSIQFPGIGQFSRADPFSLSLWIRIPEITERMVVMHRSRAWTDAGSQGYQLILEDGRPSWSLIHFWPGDAIRIRADLPIAVGEWTHIMVSHDGSARASGLELHVNGKPAPTSVIRDHLTRSITGGGPGNLTIGSRFRDRGLKDGQVDDVRVYARTLGGLEAMRLYTGEPVNLTLQPDQNVLAQHHLSAHDDVYRAAVGVLRERRIELAQALDAVPQVMTMSDMDEPRQTYRLERGRYDQRRETVVPGTPKAIMPFADEYPPNRLGLARWLTNERNPLAARVAVNRLWILAFGRGIVETTEDFGNQGSPPSHPELLDQLAVDFIESGWNVKAMLKRMLMSSTYRQVSGGDQDGRLTDPENRLLSRGAFRRLSAEMIRDHALSASGLLIDRIGGPSVHPYQPGGLWKEKSGQVYPQGEGEALYRRSLYTFWKRTSPPPSMMILDAAKRDVCVARRQETSTPLQALLLLNDPQYVEAARTLAQRAMSEGGTIPAEWIRHAFRLLATRAPNDEEMLVLMALHETQLEAFALAPEAAEELISIGDTNHDRDLDPVALAAMTTVCSTILNSDAAIMRR